MKYRESRSLAAAVIVLAWGNAGASLALPQAVELDIEMFYQYSATDDDAEVTIGVESDEPIARLRILAPDGHTVATLRSQDDLGLLEVELESAEPSVAEVKRAYPPGIYQFFGETPDGAALSGRTRLSHRVVAAPNFADSSPCDEEVDADDAVSIVWDPVSGAEGGYEIIIEQDDTGANLRVTQKAGATRFVIPAGFLAPNLVYEIEMKSVTGKGNKTSASCEFATTP